MISFCESSQAAVLREVFQTAWVTAVRHGFESGGLGLVREGGLAAQCSQVAVTQSLQRVVMAEFRTTLLDLNKQQEISSARIEELEEELGTERCLRAATKRALDKVKSTGAAALPPATADSGDAMSAAEITSLREQVAALQAENATLRVADA